VALWPGLDRDLNEFCGGGVDAKLNAFLVGSFKVASDCLASILEPLLPCGSKRREVVQRRNVRHPGVLARIVLYENLKLPRMLR